MTPRSSFGDPLHQSTPSQPKIAKISTSSFDHFDVWKAIDNSDSIRVLKFDPTQNDSRIWIGRLEYAIVEVGGNLDIHGMGVLAMFLEKEASKW